MADRKLDLEEFEAKIHDALLNAGLKLENFGGMFVHEGEPALTPNQKLLLSINNKRESHVFLDEVSRQLKIAKIPHEHNRQRDAIMIEHPKKMRRYEIRMEPDRLVLRRA